MSWAPDLIIGELRPWPDSVRVLRGVTGEGRTYVPERTCHNENEEWPSLFKCSDCGYDNSDTYCGTEAIFKYCPSCGAKVVKGDGTIKQDGREERLGKLVGEMFKVIALENSWWDSKFGDTKRFAHAMHDLGISVSENMPDNLDIVELRGL